jgi:tetratricopeptide (TPR) repeat protein
VSPSPIHTIGVAEVQDLALAAMGAAERGRAVEADQLARRALDRVEALADTCRDALRVSALRALGTAQRTRGRYRDAEETFRDALTRAAGAFGPDSVEVAELQNDLGMTSKSLGRFDDAAEAYGRARAILEALPDADPEDLAALYHNLGGLAHAQGHFATAEPLARRAVEIRSRAVGPRARATLLDRSAHAAILSGLGRDDEAEDAIRDLLVDLEPALGSDHPEVAVALNNLAAILQRRGALDEAADLYARVIATREAHFGIDAPTLAIPLNNLATVLDAQGRSIDALGLYERAIELLETSLDPGHPQLLAARRNAARAGGRLSGVDLPP